MTDATEKANDMARNDMVHNDMADNDSAKAASATHPATPVEPTRSSGAGTVFFAIFLSVLASGALVVGAPLWTPYTTEIIDLPNPMKRVVSETTRLSRLVTDLDGRVTAVTADTGKLMASASAQIQVGQGVRAATLALAGAQLRDRLAAGAPYDLELAAVRAVATGDADLTAVVESLAANAATGVPTPSTLRAAFPSAVAAVVTAEAESATRSAAGWYESVSALIGQLGYVTHLSAVPDGSVHAIVRAARERLSVGDFEGAAAQMSTLPTPRPDEADAWIAHTTARVAADKADSALLTLSLARLGAR